MGAGHYVGVDIMWDVDTMLILCGMLILESHIFEL